MPPTIEKYALQIYSIVNQITQLEKIIENQKGIFSYSKGNKDKVILDTILKLQNAKIELHNAMECLLSPLEKGK